MFLKAHRMAMCFGWLQAWIISAKNTYFLTTFIIINILVNIFNFSDENFQQTVIY